MTQTKNYEIMKKELVLSSNLEQFNQLTPDESESLMHELIVYDKEQKFNNAEDLAKGIIKDLPFIPMLHDAAIRNYLEKIAMNTSVIKIILVIYFVCSIIVGIMFLNRLGN